MGLQEDEDYAAKGATHARVSLAYMESKIALKTFTTMDKVVADGIEKADQFGTLEQYKERLSVTTLCVVVLKNGFVLTGKSAPASPQNFDAEKGRTFAYEKVIDQLWQMEGYLLCENIYLDKNE